MAWTVAQPKRPVWLYGFLGVSAASLLVYCVLSQWSPWAPGRWGGLTFGTLATMVFVVDALYPLRWRQICGRRLMAWPFGTAQRWLQFHIYGGLLACLFVMLHMGFAWPAGLFGWFLFLLTLWATASGLLGVSLQKYVPALLATNVSTEAIYERIEALSMRLEKEAEEQVAPSDRLLRFYRKNAPTWRLDTLAASWLYVASFSAERVRMLVPFREAALDKLSDDERKRLSSLEAIVIEKFELDVQYSLQRLLRAWVPLHAVPSLVLMGLLAVHIVSALLF